MLAVSLLTTLLVAAPARALSVTVYPTGSAEELTEESPLELSVQTDDHAGRVVLAVRPAAMGPCGGDPGGDPGAAQFDAPMDAVSSATGRLVLADPGSYAVCGWQVDDTGAVVDRLTQAIDVRQQPAETQVGTGGDTVYKGVPVEVTVEGDGAPGRVLQAALIAGAACPAAAPVAPETRWVTPAAGVPASNVDLDRFLTFDATGAYQLCSWVGERPGDPQPEAARGETIVVRPGRVRPLIQLSAQRSRQPLTALRFGVSIGGVSRGRIAIEVQKVVDRGGALRGSGPWRRVAAIDVAKLKIYRGPPRDYPWGSSEFALINGQRTRVPASIAAQCHPAQARVYRVRARFLGTPDALPARSRVVSFGGSVGCG